MTTSRNHADMARLRLDCLHLAMVREVANADIDRILSRAARFVDFCLADGEGNSAFPPKAAVPASATEIAPPRLKTALRPAKTR